MSVLEKLEILKKGLIGWAKELRIKKKGVKERLMVHLEDLQLQDRDDDNLTDLIETKILLNWEIENEEIYWEQQA